MKYEWYLTFHGGEGRSDLNSIHSYSAEGKKLRKALDRSSLPPDVELRELRDHAFGPDGDLYIANAYKENSQILRFRGKRNKEDKHVFRDVFVRNDPNRNPGLSHPFNMAFDADGDLLVTSQNTSLVLKYHGPQSHDGNAGSPRPLAPALLAAKNHTFSPGTFCASAKETADGLVVVRKAILAGKVLCVADRDANCIRKYDAGSGKFLGAIADAAMIDKPIHLLAHDGILYVGNRGNESVVKCDLDTGRVAAFIHPKSGGLSNPSGLAVGEDGFIYVGSRGTHQILRYRLADGWPDKRPFIDGLEDEPEFIQRVVV